MGGGGGGERTQSNSAQTYSAALQSYEVVSTETVLMQYGDSNKGYKNGHYNNLLVLRPRGQLSGIVLW